MNNEQVTTKSKKKKIKDIIGWILFGIFGVIFAFVLAGNIDGMVHKKDNAGQTLRFGYGSFVVLSDSMEPKYMKDDAIITYKDNIESIYQKFSKNNQAIIDISFVNEYPGFDFQPDNPKYKEPIYLGKTVMTHRLVEVHKDMSKEVGKGRYIFVTAGINPKSNTGQEHQYQVLTEKQYVGVVKLSSNFLGQFFKFISSVWGLILLLLIPAGYLIVTSGIDIFKTLKNAEEGVTVKGDASDVKVDSLSEKDKERLKQELLEEMIKNKQKEKEAAHEQQEEHKED